MSNEESNRITEEVVLMNVIRREPWRGFSSLQQDLEGLFNGNWLLFGDDASGTVPSLWSPAVDLREEEGKFTLQADLPGVDPENIEVTLEGGVLTIRGERKLESQQEREGYKRIERRYGEFHRRFVLPDTAAEDKVDASYRNGVLYVTIPKHERARPRQIEVQTA